MSRSFYSNSIQVFENEERQFYIGGIQFNDFTTAVASGSSPSTGDGIKNVSNSSLNGPTITVAVSPYAFLRRREPVVESPNLAISSSLDIRFDDPKYYKS